MNVNMNVMPWKVRQNIPDFDIAIPKIRLKKEDFRILGGIFERGIFYYNTYYQLISQIFKQCTDMACHVEIVLLHNIILTF